MRVTRISENELMGPGLTTVYMSAGNSGTLETLPADRKLYLQHRSAIIKVKGTVRPITRHEGPEGAYTHGATLSLTSALDEGGC